MLIDSGVVNEVATDAATLRGIQPWPRPTMAAVRELLLGSGALHLIDGGAANALQKADERQFYGQVMDAAFEALVAGRAFDLGHLPNAVIKSESKRAGALYHAGHVGHPFRQPYLLFHTWEEGGSLYVVRPDPRGSGQYEGVEFGGFIVRGERKLLMGDAVHARREADPAHPNRMTVTVRRAPVHTMSAGGDAEDPARLQLAAANITDPVMASLLMLATEGVPVERVTPSLKLNAARLRNGKPAIPAYWQVQTGDYVTALASRGQARPPGAPGGSHASPAPHLRRGHLRNKHARHGGGTVWVRDALVMLRDGQEVGATLGRSFYEMARREGAAG